MVGFLELELPKEEKTPRKLENINYRMPTFYSELKAGGSTTLYFENRPTGLPTFGTWVSEYDGIEPAKPRHIDEIGFVRQGYIKGKKLERIGF